ncbi:tRNA lysidine(34) synthetase TilS [Maribacter chungangensis]|uniref:tRNA(Ile)-lysidine synthase n=1 Tax=Maribacter chungangensis TaxID=1069117 RepID=A0ABW3B3M2_9FLAO
MLTKFKAHIDLNFPLLPNNRVLIACSGGLDSVVLSHLCHAAGLTFAIAHCNFRLRGRDSDADEAFVKELAQQLGAEVLVTHFDTLGFVNQQKVSVQMAARELRYTWFEELLETHGFEKVLTAHHLDDALETFLINLSRGTGIDGLTGMPEQTETIARPLLKFSRVELLAYAKANGLTWREDASNADVKYLRNKIRAEVVPALKELHPNFLENFKKSIGYLDQSAIIAENHIAQIKDTLFLPKNGLFKIAIGRLKELNPLEGYLYGLFKDYGFTDWENLTDLLGAMSGKYMESSTHKLLKDREYLWLSPLVGTTQGNETYTIAREDTKLTEPIPMELLEVPERNENTATIIYVDKNALKYPLQVRKWKKGDYFYPLGFKGKKKLAKFFKDEKVPVALKERQWLLCSGEDIVWIIGKRADERFKIKDDTKVVLRIEVKL